ncbi:MAG TPA: uracil-DNA glycosylase [Candidatus Acidoferrales bacterium]|nr:uracil-DNA glycosylase [Candidatus Acidoferrales bacterium]
MSGEGIRDEAAAIANAVRRLLERERGATGYAGSSGGELLAAGIARARASVARPAPAADEREAAVTVAARPGPVADEREATVAVAASAALEPLPAFTDDLFPSALAGGRAELTSLSRPTLEIIAAEARACTKCGLCRTRTQAVPGVGSAASGIVFVGEAPGADEDARGEPFVGRAGELLTRMIAAMDEKHLIPGVPLSRETVYICNVLKCRPPENRNPLPHEIEACSPYVIRQLEALQPRIICCLGKFAAELLLGIKGAVGAMRGKTYRWRGAKLIVTYHPAYCLRSPSAKRPVWDDLQRLAQEYLTD